MLNNPLKKISYCLAVLLFLSFQSLHAQNGIVKSYYADGTVQSEASYVSDVLDGSYITYFPDGKIWTEKNYSRGILDGYVREFHANGLLKEEYSVKFGIKDGAHRTYFESGLLKELINYSDGMLTNRQVFHLEFNNVETPAVKPTERKIESITLQQPVIENKQEIILHESNYEILCDVQVCPVPIGGMKGIQDSLVYPEHALRYGLEGTVTIIATIDAHGEVIKTEVLKKLGLGCDEAAQEAVRKTRFVPGKNDGKPSPTNAAITVEFKIFVKQ